MNASTARSYANVYQRRGKLKPQPCEVCGATEQIEKHHPDHRFPLHVWWLCRTHHRLLHNPFPKRSRKGVAA